MNEFNTNKIIRIIIPQQVRIRKFEVNTESLQQTLRESKKNSNLTNKQIAGNLNQPLTLVEHWFRTDKSFAIPNEDIWLKLKELLNIKTDEFDESIMTFEIRDGVYEKSNRVYDTNGIAPTLTVVSAENERYKINDEGGNITMKEFKNNLIKYNFKMDTIELFDSFAGIGALHQNLTELGVPTKIIGLSETDVDAIISYAGVHIDNFINLEFEYPSEDDMKKLLMNRNIGWDFTKNKSSIPRLKKDKLYKVYKATILLNNLGDISRLDYDNLPNFDLFNMSFPCTDISGAGQQKGLKNADGTPTRSGLVEYGIKVIKAKKPKYIMIENVKALIQKKFIDDFYDIVNEIESYGYKCYYPKKENNKQVLLNENNYLNKLNGQPVCLNAKDFGIAQNRERIFVICVRSDIDDGLFNFPEGVDSGLRLKDFLEDEVDEKYYLSERMLQGFKKHNVNHEEKGTGFIWKPKDNEDVANTLRANPALCPTDNTIKVFGHSGTGGERGFIYNAEGIMSTLTATDYKQPKQILDTNKLIQQGELDLEGYNDFSKRVYSKEGIGRTLMASGGNLNDKAGQYQMSDFRIRRLSPRECWRLMGFRDECFDKAQELGISDSALYKQAGNSIVVNCLYYIFKELFKKYIVE